MRQIKKRNHKKKSISTPKKNPLSFFLCARDDKNLLLTFSIYTSAEMTTHDEIRANSSSNSMLYVVMDIYDMTFS